ncbi:MAG: hypothetical protein GF317_16525 [Candidatus Lokiarchaeota archaeon]|nr:hypothetical protein [Candidatus Lokiarchaeota archaeon]
MDEYRIYEQERRKRSIYLFTFLISFLVLFTLAMYIPIEFGLNLITFLVILILCSSIGISFGLTIFRRTRNKKSCYLYFQNRYFEKLNDLGISYITNNSRYHPKLKILEAPNTDKAQEYKKFINLIKNYLGIRSKFAKILTYWWIGAIFGIIVILLLLIVIKILDFRYIILFFFLNFVISFSVQTVLIQRDQKFLLPLGASVRKWPPKILSKEKVREEITKIKQEYN